MQIFIVLLCYEIVRDNHHWMCSFSVYYTLTIKSVQSNLFYYPPFIPAAVIKGNDPPSAASHTYPPCINDKPLTTECVYICNVMSQRRTYPPIFIKHCKL